MASEGEIKPQVLATTENDDIAALRVPQFAIDDSNNVNKLLQDSEGCNIVQNAKDASEQSRDHGFVFPKYRQINDLDNKVSVNKAQDASEQSRDRGFVFPKYREFNNLFYIDDRQKDAPEQTRDPGFKIMPLNTAPQPLIGTTHLNTNFLLKIDDKAKDASKQSRDHGFMFPKNRQINDLFNIYDKQKDASEKTRDPGFKIVPLNTAPRPLIGTTHLNTHILLKIDDKANGLNSKLAVKNSPSNRLISRAPTLIIGMDVSHDDSPRHPGGPAIATVVHSRTWPVISEYRAYAPTQVSSLPMIEFFRHQLPPEEKTDVGIMREILQDFYTNSGERMPEQIIIFRYSLGEAGYEQILKNEIDDLIEACKLFDEKCRPKFVVIKFREPVGPLNGNPYQLARAGYYETNVPVDYGVLLDEVCESPGDIADLVDSFSYLYQMRTAAMTQFSSLNVELCGVAPDLYGWTPGGRLRRWKMRECIDDGVELAVYALTFLNFERDVKHAFVRLRGWSSELDKSGVVKQHVSMEAREMNGDVVTILAHLRYSGSEYVSIEHCVIRPASRTWLINGGNKYVYVPISQSLLDRKRLPPPQ